MDINPQTDNNTNQPLNQEEKLGYVYRHIRLDTNMPFYIGISAVNDEEHTRAYSKNRNNADWKDITKNTKYRVDILLENIPITLLGKKEKYFIKLYGRIDLGTGTLVNKTSGGAGTREHIKTPEQIEKHRKAITGYKHTEEAKKNMSDFQKTKVLSEETKQKMRDSTPSKKVGQYKDGILIKEYPSVISTKLDGYSISKVSLCCNGKRESHKGFQWKFSVNGVVMDKIDVSISVKVENKKQVAQYTLDNNFIRIYPSIESTKNYGFRRSGVSACVNSKRKSHKGFIWKFL